jgi:hypothetical protein
MHQSDDAKNPTEYARRFGIFPGRTDGRSRTSPTRSPSRQIQFPNGVVRSGQDVFNHFEELARSQNQDLDEIMTDGAPHLRNMELEEQAFMDAYEDLTVDEFWQGVLFGDMTMDEVSTIYQYRHLFADWWQLKAGDHFPMGPAPSDLYGLRGPLHPYAVFTFHKTYTANVFKTSGEISLVARRKRLCNSLAKFYLCQR